MGLWPLEIFLILRHGYRIWRLQTSEVYPRAVRDNIFLFFGFIDTAVLGPVTDNFLQSYISQLVGGHIIQRDVSPLRNSQHFLIVTHKESEVFTMHLLCIIISNSVFIFGFVDFRWWKHQSEVEKKLNNLKKKYIFEWMKSYIAYVSSRRLFRVLNIESNLARPVIIQIPTQSPGRYTAELPLRRIKLFFIPSKFPSKYSHFVDFLGSCRMETAPTSIEFFLHTTLCQSDEPSFLRGTLSPTTRHRCTHVLVYTSPGKTRRSPLQLWTGPGVA